ncbi:MAG: hypothetical protein EAZ85_02705 [Bacteroidetes bacterium]|nr:MAG: hypothetical protein EAZ85_02705 [Bacteroidota bacterium]TAG86227.1 MAG: hypothetical protein EAZ20_13250 [Bacteroidota bacterium]
MKKYKIVLVCILIIFTFNQCKNRNNTPQNLFTCEIDGVQWETTKVTTQVVQSGSLFTVDIVATHNNGQAIYLKIYSLSQSGQGNYPLGNPNFQNEATFAPQGNFNQSSQNWKSAVTCNSPQGNYIQIDELQNGFLNGSFVTSVCFSTGTIKKITNGKLFQLVVRI